MKNGYLVLSLVISTLILSSCGNNTKSSNESTDNSQQTDFTTTAISTTTSDEVATTTLTTSEVTQDVHEDTFITNVKKNLDYAKENMFSNVLFNVVFILNPLLVFLYRNTMKEGSAILYDTMESIEKIELFIALAGVAWVKDTVCMPMIFPAEKKLLLYPWRI